jgi:hypothetical protein
MWIGRFGFGGLFFLAPLVLGIVALVDAIGRPEPVWKRAGQERTLWIVLIAVGLVLCVVGAIIDIVYLATIRPALVRADGARTGGAYPGSAGAGVPAAGWFPDPYHRHQVRWFDGVAWTEHVADGGVSSRDPLR